MTAHNFGPQEHARLPPGAMWSMYCTHCEKRGYNSRKDARRAAKTFHPGESQRTYQCSVLDVWHYGHRPDWVTQGKPNPQHVRFIMRAARRAGHTVLGYNLEEILMELDQDTIRVLRVVADAVQYDPDNSAPHETIERAALRKVADQGLIERRRTFDGTDTGRYQLRAAGFAELERQERDNPRKGVDTPPAGG